MADLKLKIELYPGTDWPRLDRRIKLPASITVISSISVGELALAVEALLREAGMAVTVCLVINLLRDQVVPPHETVSSSFDPGQGVSIVTDVTDSLSAPPRGRVHLEVEGVGSHLTSETTNKLPERAAASLLRSVPRTGKIPIMILTGFLGAGKTTFLNRLLHEQREQKIAVIENEFGAVPIDNELIATKMSTTEQVVVMENGCMCCSVCGDILGAFASIFEAVEKGNGVDSVLIETTGMADPVPIVRTLLQTPDIASHFRLNGVVTLVDCKNVLNRLQVEWVWWWWWGGALALRPRYCGSGDLPSVRCSMRTALKDPELAVVEV